MSPDERVQRHKETIERLRADIEWLTQTGFWTSGATNEELIDALDQTARLYSAFVEELTRPPG